MGEKWKSVSGALCRISTQKEPERELFDCAFQSEAADIPHPPLPHGGRKIGNPAEDQPSQHNGDQEKPDKQIGDGTARRTRLL